MSRRDNKSLLCLCQGAIILQGKRAGAMRCLPHGGGERGDAAFARQIIAGKRDLSDCRGGFHCFVRGHLRNAAVPGYGVNTPLFARCRQSKLTRMAKLFPAPQIRDAGNPDLSVASLATDRLGSLGPAHPPAEARLAAALLTERVLPHPAICRVKAAGFGDYADCLVERPHRCPHALGFGHGFFCRHPQWHELVMFAESPGA